MTERPNAPHDFYQILGDMQDVQWSFFKEMLAIHQTIHTSLPGSLKEIMDHGRKIASPLTIFSPDVVNDTLAKTKDFFYKQLDQNPDKLCAIGLKHFEKQQRLYVETLSKVMGERSEIIIHSPLGDRRFTHPAWDSIAFFSFLKQHYLLFVELVQDIMSQLKDMDPRTKSKIEFYTKQLVHALSPTNFPATNPDVLLETIRTKGENIKKGMANLLKDIKNGTLQMTDMNAFQVGKNIAATKGSVIYENELLQVIHYTPTQEKVHSTPVLIIPAWINKYYMFDLSGENSFVKWCVDHGVDVYMISWINPNKHHRDKTFCDYALEGLYKAVHEVQHHSSTGKINAFANCAGGILLNCLMAYLEAHHIESPFASSSTLASPIDVDYLGDLKAFICDAQLKMLDESLDDFGIVPGQILVQSFNLLRPHDLLWSFYVKHYLMGHKPEAFDILFWNCDSVNLPGRMHSQYLRHIFLENKLVKEGAMRIAGTPIDFRKIKTPAFILGAIKDHIVPWQSVYPLSQLISSEIKEYLLVGSGHVSGIINPPWKDKYQYWVNKAVPTSSEEWFDEAVEYQGSWWHYWLNWMQPFLGELKVPNPQKEPVIESAPGRYVLERHTA